MLPLDERVVRQYSLHKQHLSSSSKADSVVQVIDDIVGLHATSAETPYLSLFARMKRFRKEHLDKELYVKRSLIRLAAMRGTLFITSVKLAPVLFQATKWSELQLSKWLGRWGMQPSHVAELTAKLIDVLRGGVKTLSEIKRSLPRGIVRSLELRVGNDVYRMTNVNVVLSALVSKGLVVSEKGEHSLHVTQANRYHLLEKTYPDLKMEWVRPEDAKTMLITRYIEAFGPVSVDDVAWWTGFNRTEVRNSLAAIENKLLFVELKGFERDFTMLKADYTLLARFKPKRSHTIELLPYEDPYPKGYKVRDRIADAEHEKKAYIGGGVQPTILLDGKIAGVWHQNIKGQRDRTELRFFSQPEKSVEKDAVRKAKAIANLMTERDIDVEVTVES